MDKPKERNIITDKLVVEKTGKTMEEWFKILDKKGAKKMKHSEIYNLVNGIKELKVLGQWNQNLFATTYEWNRGLKERGQRDDGFEISISKTINAGNKKLFEAWINEKERDKWLTGTEIDIRKFTENKSLVITWPDEITTVRVEIYNKGDNKSQVVVQQMKIPDSKSADKMKRFWSEKINTLKNLMES